MLPSPCLRSGKGPYGVIWVAAYFARRLSKHQVTGIDIPSSVDKILIDEWPSVSYRILAYLLLGVVRIFSKKVEYVLYDCHRIVNELNNFVLNKRTTSSKDLVRQPKFSITLPERYELDAFILEVPDGMDRGHVAREEDIVLKEPFQRDGFSNFSFHKYSQVEATATQGGAVTTSCRSVGVLELGSCSTPDAAAADKSFSTKLIHSSRTVRTIEVSLQEIERVRFTQEECLDFQMFYEKNEADHLEILNSSSFATSNVEHIDEFEEVQIEDCDLVADEGEELTVQSCGDVETPLENQDPEAAQNKDVCFTVSGTPETILSCPFAATTPEVTIPSTEGPTTTEQLGVKTPAKKERPRKPKNLRCLFDENMVLSSKSLKRGLDDATDLARKKRKAHHILNVWRSSLIPSFLQNFCTPLIPWSVSELPEIPQERKTMQFCQDEGGEESDKAQSLLGVVNLAEVIDCSDRTRSLLAKDVVNLAVVRECSDKSQSLAGADQVEVPEDSGMSVALLTGADQVGVRECSDKNRSILAEADQVEVGKCCDKTLSSLGRVNVQSDIAPGTPVPRSASTRTFESSRAGDLDAMRQSKSFGSSIRELSVEEEVVLPDWTNEEMDQSEVDIEESHGWSRRTRNFADFLHQFLMNKYNHEEDGVVNLSSLLRGKMKKESARLFYEILVLKSGGYVKVKQDKPYNDIIVQRTPKWKQMWETPSSSQSVL